MADKVKDAVAAELSGVVPNWKYSVEYVGHDGCVTTQQGQIHTELQSTAAKYVSAKFRKESASGLFRHFAVVPIDSQGNTIIGKVGLQSSMPLGVPTVLPKAAAEFAKIPAFVYKYVTQIRTEDSKKHKFYSILPHD